MLRLGVEYLHSGALVHAAAALLHVKTSRFLFSDSFIPSVLFLSAHPLLPPLNSNQGIEVICHGGWQQGVYYAGMLLARMLDFRLLPCCKVIVIMSWLTVADFAFEVQMSFPSNLKSPSCHNLVMINQKNPYPTPNIRHRLWISIYLQTQIGWNGFDSPNFHTDYFVEIEY